MEISNIKAECVNLNSGLIKIYGERRKRKNIIQGCNAGNFRDFEKILYV